MHVLGLIFRTRSRFARTRHLFSGVLPAAFTICTLRLHLRGRVVESPRSDENLSSDCESELVELAKSDLTAPSTPPVLAR